jgi:hypothetical protein
MLRPARFDAMRTHLVWILALAPCGLGAAQQAPPPIADNSFLLEEAYNQEAGVVQHISAFHRSLRTAAWTYTFTQEWPVVVQRHQLSFTLPVERIGAAGATVTGIGDIALNYRYQLVGGDRAVAVAPRLSLLMPTGSEANGIGSGAFGVQVNVPVSVTLAPRFVAHGNAGWSATSGVDEYGLGASVVWLTGPMFNVLVEVVWSHAEGGGDALIVNPGIRWAHNFASGLQIVPGIAFPIGLGPSAGEGGVFLYLSFEHPFRRAVSSNRGPP